MDYRFIELCKVGDSSAIESFVQTYQQDVYRLALSILDNAAEAEDATQHQGSSSESRYSSHTIKCFCNTDFVTCLAACA